MGLMAAIGALFGVGGGRNVVAETAGIFTVNKEAQAMREAAHRSAALAQYAAEFHMRPGRTWLDSLADGLNRLVRPVVTLGLFAPIVMTIRDPEGMAEVWRAVATLPTGYWAVVGIVLPFYFGGRMQMKALDAGHWRAAADAAAELTGDGPVVADRTPDAPDDDPNAALDDWRAGRGN